MQGLAGGGLQLSALSSAPFVPFFRYSLQSLVIARTNADSLLSGSRALRRRSRNPSLAAVTRSTFDADLQLE